MVRLTLVPVIPFAFLASQWLQRPPDALQPSLRYVGTSGRRRPAATSIRRSRTAPGWPGAPREPLQPDLVSRRLDSVPRSSVDPRTPSRPAIQTPRQMRYSLAPVAVGPAYSPAATPQTGRRCTGRTRF